MFNLYLKPFTAHFRFRAFEIDLERNPLLADAPMYEVMQVNKPWPYSRSVFSLVPCQTAPGFLPTLRLEPTTRSARAWLPINATI